MRKHFNITDEQRRELAELDNSACDLYEILDYFENIRPKAYKRLLKRVARSYGLKDVDDEQAWNELSYDGTTDDIVLDVKNEILERCGITFEWENVIE